MPIFAVTYDLNKDKDYQKLWDEFKRLKGHKAAASFYLVNLKDTSVKDVRDHFKKFIDDNDTLIIVKTSIANIATHRPFKGTADWINNNSD